MRWIRVCCRDSIGKRQGSNGWILLLVAELLGEHDLLLTLDILNLPFTGLDNFLDDFLLFLKFGDIGSLLVLQLILELSKKVDVTWREKYG